MQYALLIYHDGTDDTLTEAERGTMYGEYVTYTDDLRKRGAMESGAPLTPPASATTVRVREGKRAVTDGPFAETKEWLGGFYLINAETLDQALEAAAMCPGAKYGAIEVRPVPEM